MFQPLPGEELSWDSITKADTDLLGVMPKRSGKITTKLLYAIVAHALHRMTELLIKNYLTGEFLRIFL